MDLHQNQKDDFGLEDLVEDLELLRHSTGFKSAFFAGHSLGGMIAPAYALKYPAHVKSIRFIIYCSRQKYRR